MKLVRKSIRHEGEGGREARGDIARFQAKSRSQE